MIPSRKKTILNKNWKFSLSGKSKKTVIFPDDITDPIIKLPAKVPGTVHTDLIQNKIINDPFYADNELKQGWITQCDWIYETKFDHKIDKQKNYDLVFEGIDTISEVYFNGVLLGCSDNMFITYRYNINKLIRKSANHLKIIIKSPVQYSLNEEKRLGKLPVALNSSRVYIRKAQYSFGWDWGPAFPTSGLWKNVYIDEWNKAQIEHVNFYTINCDNKSADIKVKVNLKVNPASSLKLAVILSDDTRSFEQHLELNNNNTITIKFRINNPKLWYPNGEGDQNLYKLNVKLIDELELLDERIQLVGIRTIKLLLSDKSGPTFKLKVNEKIVYCKGVNWIPADSFLPRIKKDRYSELLSLAKQANMNIVRVWGGGIYENDEFYSICDELGLLVWQDFMFACGSYPEHPDFIENVKEEVTQNIIRLQAHPSIALWCGNNENEWIWYQDQKSSFEKMPGYKIYHNVIPRILKKLDPVCNYWPTSPFSFEEDPNSYLSGNNHQWNIWSRWIDYKEVVNDSSHFITEFGFQGTANKDTFEKYIPAENRKISDSIFEHHNKQVEGTERVIKFLANHLPLKTNWDDFLYLSQLNQAFALKTCLEHWRTNRKTNGSIIWQLNDCWPVTSWAIIDSEIKPKISYHFVKNSFAPHLLFFRQNKNEIILNLLNTQHGKIDKAILTICLISTINGKVIKQEKFPVAVDKQKEKSLASFNLKKLQEDKILFAAVLYDESGNVISRNYLLNIPWKHVKLPKPKLKTKIIDTQTGKYLEISAANPVFFIDVYLRGYTFSERGFFLLPGEKIKLAMLSDKPGKLIKPGVKVFCLNNYLS